MAKLVDAPDLGSGVLRRVGSSPITRTMRQKRNFTKKFLFFCCKIDNTCSNRSQDAWRSHALRVAVGKCCQFYYQNRQCRQRLVKRSTGEARTVWAAIRRYCQFQKCDEAVEGLIKIEGKIYQFNSRSELENLKIN